jgi:hypothetical protein
MKERMAKIRHFFSQNTIFTVFMFNAMRAILVLDYLKGGEKWLIVEK